MSSRDGSRDVFQDVLRAHEVATEAMELASKAYVDTAQLEIVVACLLHELGQQAPGFSSRVREQLLETAGSVGETPVAGDPTPLGRALLLLPAAPQKPTKPSLVWTNPIDPKGKK